MSYKQLGVSEGEEIKQTLMEEKLREDYSRRVRVILERAECQKQI